MSEIVIFSGTPEGRTLSAYLEGARVRHSVCVASDYGEVVMEPSVYTRIHTGRMEQKEMEEYLRKVTCSTVVDATHPFALNASEVIKAAADHLGIPYLRMLKDASDETEYGDMTYFKDAKECAKALTQTDGNILITSGGKDLNVFCADESLRERVYARVLPSTENLELCETNGVTGNHILGLLGPFSEELNYAMLQQYAIKVMVTQESGVIEGFGEKVAAAKRAGTKMFVVGNADEHKGLTFNEVLDELEEILMVKLEHEKLVSVSVAGVGIGDKKLRTVAVEKKIKHADMIFGPERLIEDLTGNTYPFTKSSDILPIIELELKNTNKLHLRAVVLFDGDISLSSEAVEFVSDVEAWKNKQKGKVEVFKLPGVSSVAYFAAQIQKPYDNLPVISLCDKKETEEWKSEFVQMLKKTSKMYLLVSGVSQLQEVALLMKEQNFTNVKLILGYQLSEQNETIAASSLDEILKLENDGNFILYLENEQLEKRKLSFSVAGEENKNTELLQVVLGRLQLQEGEVLLDVGAGRGDFAVAAAAMSDQLCVYAVEKEEEALAKLQSRKGQCALGNLNIVEGIAPEIIRSLPDADAAFVEFNDGNIMEILKTLRTNNPKMKVAVVAKTLEDILELQEIAKQYTVSNSHMVQIGVREILTQEEKHMIGSNDSVVLYTFQFGE